MRRIETYVGVQVYEWFFSAQAQYTMTAIAKVCSALLGTSGVVNGLSCGPTSPATMTVQIGAGEIYQMESLEATTCGTLPADTTHQILKQGIQLGTYTTATFATPTSSGQSINYLIEAQYQDSDISLDPTTGASPIVELFYNSTNPQSPWSGPNNSGNPSNTFRDGVIAYQIKAGAAATTGSQVTPTPDSGWIGLWVVTVAFGQSSITSSSISQYTGSPILPTGILQSILSSNLTYGIDSGTAGVVQAKFPIPVTSLADGMDVWVKIAAANPSTATFTPNPGVIAAAPVVGAAHAALQGGELIANGRANLVYRADITSWVLVECTGAAIQIAPATQSQHAVQFGQVSGIVGQSRGAVMSVAAASATGSWSAKELVVETALGGLRYCIASPSFSVSLGTTGAGGMDTGSAPVSGYVALYAIYNPTTQTLNGLAVNATSAIVPEVYGNGHMPSGYTASALVSVWPTNGSGQFVVGDQRDREFDIFSGAIYTGSGSGSFVSLNLSAAVPPNAIRWKPNWNVSTSATGGVSIGFSAVSAGNGNPGYVADQLYANSSTQVGGNFPPSLIKTTQTSYFATAGSGSFTINSYGYFI